MLRQIIQKKNSPILQLISKEKLEELLDSNKSFKIPWFGQLMTGPQLIAHLVQMNIWLEKYNVNLVDL